MAKDYYKVLGVDRDATDTDIKQAFRKLAHEHHPDKKTGNEEKFKEANEAYQVLSDKQKRQQYDQFGSTFEGMGNQGGFSWENMNTHGGNPFSGGFSQTNFDFGDLGDVLGDMFGFGGNAYQRSARSQRGASVQTTIDISFDEAYSGVEKTLELSLNTVCDQCNGSGNDPSANITSCKSCDGKGSITSVRNTMLGAMQTQQVCPDCSGLGTVSDKKCSACRGATIQKVRKSIKVKIPAGIDDDKIIRLSGKGEAGPNNGTSGDLLIKVHVESHPHFIRDGYDIRSREEVPLSTLILGGYATIRTPTGRSKLKIPKGTTSGKTFILKNKGFERLSGTGKGDLRISIHASVPDKLTAKQRKLLEEFENTIENAHGPKSWW